MYQNAWATTLALYTCQLEKGKFFIYGEFMELKLSIQIMWDWGPMGHFNSIIDRNVSLKKFFYYILRVEQRSIFISVNKTSRKTNNSYKLLVSYAVQTRKELLSKWRFLNRTGYLTSSKFKCLTNSFWSKRELWCHSVSGSCVLKGSCRSLLSPDTHCCTQRCQYNCLHDCALLRVLRTIPFKVEKAKPKQ